MVLTTYQTILVTARVAFRAGVDGFVCDHRRIFWHGVLLNFYRQTAVDYRPAFCTQSYFKFCLHAFAIRLVLGTLIWALYTIWHTSPELRWVVYANIPYLLWVSFATVLQLTIIYLNK